MFSKFISYPLSLTFSSDASGNNCVVLAQGANLAPAAHASRYTFGLSGRYAAIAVIFCSNWSRLRDIFICLHARCRRRPQIDFTDLIHDVKLGSWIDVRATRHTAGQDAAQETRPPSIPTHGMTSLR